MRVYGAGSVLPSPSALSADCSRELRIVTFARLPYVMERLQEWITGWEVWQKLAGAIGLPTTIVGLWRWRTNVYSVINAAVRYVINAFRCPVILPQLESERRRFGLTVLLNGVRVGLADVGKGRVFYCDPCFQNHRKLFSMLPREGAKGIVRLQCPNCRTKWELDSHEWFEIDHWNQTEEAIRTKS